MPKFILHEPLAMEFVQPEPQHRSRDPATVGQIPHQQHRAVGTDFGKDGIRLHCPQLQDEETLWCKGS